MEMKMVLTDKEVAQAIAVGLRASGLKPLRCQFKIGDDGALTAEITIDRKPMTDEEIKATAPEVTVEFGR